jgi:hypothetical protein
LKALRMLAPSHTWMLFIHMQAALEVLR